MTSVDYASIYHRAKEQAAWDLANALGRVSIEDVRMPGPNRILILWESCHRCEEKRCSWFDKLSARAAARQAYAIKGEVCRLWLKCG